MGIVYAALKANKVETPAFSVINIDSSLFMLQYNEQYLWKHFVREYPVCAEITTSYRINSWVNEGAAAGSNVWLTASYLFDHSENATETAASFNELAKAFEPSRLLLLSAASKSDKVRGVAQALRKSGYDDLSGKNRALGQVFTGPLNHVGQYRDSLQQQADYEFSGVPSWSMEGLYGVVLGKKQGAFFVKPQEKIDLYVLLEKERVRILLTEEQQKAASHVEKQVIVVGPAGCGKSVVLTQRVKNIVEDPVRPYDPDLRMLVTTFNKDLARHLGDWIEQLLDKERCRRHSRPNGQKTEPYSWFTFEGSDKRNISVFNFDLLPTRLG
ncbi:MAG TPA: UvrD-helicase domain-containing protein, partial [Puia sp.]|nr:UvrD-helicase domain-containing protein [Puia sp.]